MTDLTPMMRQYQDIKNQHQDAILFFRLGDFYEMFFDDAKIASRELEITLTGRPTGTGRKLKIPMCGIPYHAASGYISRLLNRGFKVAICEQTEDPATAVGLTRREVIKIITPGTLTESEFIPVKKNNFLMSLVVSEDGFGLAYADISTGEFRITEFNDGNNLESVLNEIDRIAPSECLLEETTAAERDKPLVKFLKDKNIPISTYEGYQVFEPDQILTRQFKVKSLTGFGCQKMPLAQAAAAAVLVYLKKTQKSDLNQIFGLKTYSPKQFMYLDAATRRNLEIVRTLREESYEGSLLWLLDQTRTAMGARLLKQWLLEPLLNAEIIDQRLEAVAELEKDYLLAEKLEAGLGEIHDLERLAVRVAGESANGRDLVGLKNSLKNIPEIFKILSGTKAGLLKPEENLLKPAAEIFEIIEKTIVEDPPIIIKEGHLIKKGANPELDELQAATSDSKIWIARFEAQEKERTGIKSLKVGFTSVFGYYIEVTKNNLEQVPAEYIRKQTLVNCERFITPDLKEKEAFILNAQVRREKLEYEIFVNLRRLIAGKIEPVRRLGGFLAAVDVLLALARSARSYRLVRPKILPMGLASVMKIKNARHPVLEKLMKNASFIPNDIELGGPANFFQIITGPNMAGKSTYMRQAALISLMAQIGSFVPADSAEIPLVDRIFTRVGAIDDIFGGQSTFMVEMSEVANILNHATVNSLIILDEIGRGTSTYDGMSIAQSVAEYICQHIQAKTFFATHYHELTTLAGIFPGIKNYTVSIREVGDEIIFLYRVVPGRASKSYGIHVAKLAGIPREVIKRAREILLDFETKETKGRRPTRILPEDLPDPEEGLQLELV